MSRVLAFDFGASSGRAILGAYENGELSYQEVHRFENNPRDKDGHFRWDFEDLLANVRLGAQKAGPVDSLAFDTWGVDFGLLDTQGRLLENPVHYRDQRTAGLVEEAFQSLPAGALYGATGTQILNINSLYQLLALQRQEPQLWEKAHRLLFMPDLFAWALCGAQACETTIASTSQLLDPRSQSWSQQVLSAFHIPQELFAPLVKSGTVAGEYQGAKVIAAAGHDTQCAVAAMPAPEKDAAFLSCGTWSLLGCELEEPVLTEQSRVLGLSNEGFGLFAGTAVNDTSSVTAAAAAWDGMHPGANTLDTAAIVKMTRTLAIIPITLVLALLRTRREGKQDGTQVDIKKIFPWFVLLFLLASIITTVLPIPAAAVSFLKNASKFFIVMAMAAIGLNTDIVKLVKTGGKPIFMGFCCWVAIAGVSLLVQHLLGIW